MRVANSEQNAGISFHQDFMARVLSEFFQGEKDKALFYWLNNSWETRLSKQEEEGIIHFD